eukprot:scaffold7040_cov256-Pinguiococcus_pyrenoidosus.AAC.22
MGELRGTRKTSEPSARFEKLQKLGTESRSQEEAQKDRGELGVKAFKKSGAKDTAVGLRRASGASPQSLPREGFKNLKPCQHILVAM